MSSELNSELRALGPSILTIPVWIDCPLVIGEIVCESSLYRGGIPASSDLTTAVYLIFLFHFKKYRTPGQVEFEAPSVLQNGTTTTEGHPIHRLQVY
jgi:hypothetical protein